MKKRTITLLILITSLSVAGILFIQVYWVKNAVQLQEAQFDNKVQLILKGVVNRLFDERLDATSDTTYCEDPHCDHCISIVFYPGSVCRPISFISES